MDTDPPALERLRVASLTGYAVLSEREIHDALAELAPVRLFAETAIDVAAAHLEKCRAYEADLLFRLQTIAARGK